MFDPLPINFNFSKDDFHIILNEQWHRGGGINCYCAETREAEQDKSVEVARGKSLGITNSTLICVFVMLITPPPPHSGMLRPGVTM